jgi:ankyrin repeat protein
MRNSYTRISIVLIALATATVPSKSAKHELEVKTEGPPNKRITLDDTARKWDEQEKLKSAIRENNVEQVKELLAHGVSPNNSPQCAEGFDEDEPEDNCIPPLSLAAKKGNVEIVKLLLDAGADPNATDIHEYAALHEVVSVECHQPEHVKITQLLLEYGAIANALQENATPLYFLLDNVINENSLRILRLLLYYGAWVDYKEEEVVTWNSLAEVFDTAYSMLNKGQPLSSTLTSAFRFLALYGGNMVQSDFERIRDYWLHVSESMAVEYSVLDMETRYNELLGTLFDNALIPAIITNNSDRVKKLSAANKLVIEDKEGVEKPIADKAGISALAYAAGQGNEEILGLLLAHSAYQYDTTGLERALEIVASRLRDWPDQEDDEYRPSRSYVQYQKIFGDLKRQFLIVSCKNIQDFINQAAEIDPALPRLSGDKSGMPNFPQEIYDQIIKQMISSEKTRMQFFGEK